MSQPPDDEPEGKALVLVSKTLFEEIVRADARNLRIEWGEPVTEMVTHHPCRVIEEVVHADHEGHT